MVPILRIVLTPATLTAIRAQTVISPVPSNIKSQYNITSSWYSKYLDAFGVPIFGSNQIEDRTLVKAYRYLQTLLWTSAYFPVQQLNKLKIRMLEILVARNKKMSSIPEFYARYKTRLDERYWGGSGGTPEFPLSTASEANILDNLHDKCIFPHKFAHTLHLCALRFIDPNCMPELTNAWNKAMRNDLWRNTYAGSNIEEYFAEALTSYFSCNRPGPKAGDGIHNDIDTRDKLAAYDPKIYNLLQRIYGGKWMWLQSNHLTKVDDTESA